MLSYKDYIWHCAIKRSLLNLSLFFLFLLLPRLLHSQAFSTETIHLINGYRKAIQGETLPYFSLYRQYAKEALLTRCTDGKKIIEWETDSIPEKSSGDYAYFSWIAAHSSGTSSDIRHFDLYINDAYVLTFNTSPKRYPAYWYFEGNNGTALQFEFKTKDGANDSHGLAYLKVPLSVYQKGQALKLKVIGHNQNSNDWYMTFKYAFKEKVEITGRPFLLKDKKHQVLNVTVLHFGQTESLRLAIKNLPLQSFRVKNGFNTFEIAVPAVVKPTPVSIKADIGNVLSVTETITLKPVTYRELNLIHHSHTDIGYSHVQEDVIQIHNSNIRQALHLIKKTSQYPKNSRFIWHIESSWVADNFLNEASTEEKENFISAVKKGQIVISANYANIMTGLCMPEELNWINDFSVQLRDQYKLPIYTAMLSDVPGMSWSVVPSLAKRGIRYFSNGINYIEGMPGNGDRIGHALEKHGDKPFWWKSSSGSDSILMWCGGKGYSSWHGTAQGAIAELGPEKIATYLDQLDKEQYPYELVQWRYNIVADNGPTDSTLCDFTANWNKNYASPKLVVANIQELFTRFEKQYSKTIPSYSGDFTPYWEDGAYSTAKEETENRLTAQKIISLEKLIHQKKPVIDEKDLVLAKKYVVLFHEHTWGAHNSISEPDAEFVKRQWRYKKGYLDSALFYTSRLEKAIINQLKLKETITLFNTLDYERDSYIELPCPTSYNIPVLKDEKGNTIPVQRLNNGSIAFIAQRLPANSKTSYKLINATTQTDTNTFYSHRLSVNEKKGVLNSIITTEKEWVDTSRFGGMPIPLYVPGLNPLQYETARLKKAEWTEHGPVKKTLQLFYELTGTNGTIISIHQYNKLDYLHISITTDKKTIRTKESLHFALPFNIKNAITRIGSGDRFFSPEHQQLSGSNHDYYLVQRWINIANESENVTLVSPQGALFEIGEMVNEEKTLNGYKKWKESGSSSSILFLYAMNNYWHTNFKADQEGITQFDLYLKFSKKPFDRQSSHQFGYNCTQPVIIIPPAY